MRDQLKDYSRKLHGDVKRHGRLPPHRTGKLATDRGADEPRNT